LYYFIKKIVYQNLLNLLPIKFLVKRKDLDNLEISDEMLMKLLELPPEAFEIYLDPATGKETLRVRSAYLREQAKLVRSKKKFSVLSIILMKK